MSEAANDAILGRVMLAFDGERLPDWVAARLGAAPAAGMTVFCHHNVRTPGQVRELTDAFQAVARGATPRLVAADQEGGQLQALGDGPTAFAGNMALGAVGDSGLAERVGEAIGLEARAMGVNVIYAPVMDLASNPANVAIGTRAFGDEPAEVARLGSAMVRGLQRVGVAAAIKHFPGLGDAGEDTHHGIAVVDGTRERLDTVSLPPFRVGIAAGARLVMSSHVAVPALTGGEVVPATLSRAVMTDILRDELGFDGITISDALDMRALAQGDGQDAQIAAAVAAGVDLFLCGADRVALGRIEDALVATAESAAIQAGELAASLERVSALRAWLGSAGPVPDLSIVGGAAHEALARELAARSMTLVRDPAGVLPLRLDGDATILAIMPTPTDLTPADTSSSVQPGLAAALRAYHARVDELVVPTSPTDGDIAAARERALTADVVVVGTLDARREAGQVALVAAFAGTGRPTVAVALRTPWDVTTYPSAMATVCTYSIHPASLDALAASLFGTAGWPGRLPVALAG